MNSVVKWLIVAFLAWWIIHDPAAVGAEVGRIGALASQAASSLSTVVSSI